jgi:hypothetical protein
MVNTAPFCYRGCVEQSSLIVFDLDAQAFAAAAVDVDGLQFAALDLVQHGLAGDAEGLCGLAEGQPAVGDRGPDFVPEGLVDADVPGGTGGELLAGDERVAQPLVEGVPGDARIFSALPIETTRRSSPAGLTFGGSGW